jgi:hypothetical protein
MDGVKYTLCRVENVNKNSTEINGKLDNLYG